MRNLTLLAFCLFSGVLLAADTKMPAEETKSAAVHLLEVRRLRPGESKEAPDGLAFTFLVTRNPGAAGAFTIKETRDATIAGKSYVETTRVVLGRVFEPHTVVDSPGKFFVTHPQVKPPANTTYDRGAVVLIALGGAKLMANDPLELTLQVGFGAKAHDFPFVLKVPAP